MSEDLSGVAPDRLIIPDGRYSFLSEQLESSFDESRKPFGFSIWRLSSGIPLLLLSNNRVTALVPLPVAGPGARKQSRLCNGFYTWKFSSQV